MQRLVVPALGQVGRRLQMDRICPPPPSPTRGGRLGGGGRRSSTDARTCGHVVSTLTLIAACRRSVSVISQVHRPGRLDDGRADGSSDRSPARAASASASSPRHRSRRSGSEASRPTTRGRPGVQRVDRQQQRSRFARRRSPPIPASPIAQPQLGRVSMISTISDPRFDQDEAVRQQHHGVDGPGVERRRIALQRGPADRAPRRTWDQHRREKQPRMTHRFSPSGFR